MNHSPESTPTPVVDEFEFLPVAVRVHAVRRRDPLADEPKLGPWRPDDTVRTVPQRTIVFDCETTTDHTQRLLFGSYQLFVDEATHRARRCVEEGFFYADDLPEIDPHGYAELVRYVARHRSVVSHGLNPKLRLLSRAEFVEQILWKWGHLQHATIVGFNLPFDLSRLALAATPAGGRNRGGISLRLWEHLGGEHPFRPRIVMRTIDRHRTLIEFATTADRKIRHHRGRFLDLRTLSFAHTNDRGLSLETACAAFGVDYIKRDVEHGVITADYITYCREDVDATLRLFRATMAEHRRHPINLKAHNTLSAATVGRAYWKAMGIGFTDERLPGFSPEVLGWGMAAFYGGRAECRIRKVDVPVTYVDFRSMYLTCNALMDTWKHITAEHVRLDDVTTEAASLVAQSRNELAEQFSEQEAWTLLHTLVEVDPNDALLPVRAKYDIAADTWGIGVNPLRSTDTAWYAMADVLAAVILGGPRPIVRRAYRLVPEGQAQGLKRIELCGDIELRPGRDDFFRAVVEHRHRVDNDNDRTPEDRQRITRFLKVLASASGFGTLAEYSTLRTTEPVIVDVHTHRGVFAAATTNPEVPGNYCFPPLAAIITAAARLMLALLEHAVTEAGGTYAFCDTDSMTIVSTKAGGLVPCLGGDHQLDGADAVRALSWLTVDAIVERFADFNPYDRSVLPGSILKLETENFDTKGRRREVRCHAISAKRYLLTTTTGEIVRKSEHGLGHLVNPDPDAAIHWIDQAWTYLRDPSNEPAWLDLPALSKVTVSSADMLGWFAPINCGLDYPDQIKPANFLFLAHPDRLDLSDGLPVAPFETDPDQWLQLPWIDRNSGQPIRVTTAPIDGGLRESTVRIQSFRDVLARYLAHPEAKALGSDRRPVRPDTVGVLRRRPVHAITPAVCIGKEATDLEDHAIGLNRSEQQATTYQHSGADLYAGLVVPTLRTMSTVDVANGAGVPLHTVQRALAGRNIPRADARQRLTNYAVEHARRHVGTVRRTEPARNLLYRFLNARQSNAQPDE